MWYHIYKLGRSAAHRSKYAFTLLELLATVAIVGIIAAIAIPSYSKYITLSRVTTMYDALSAIKFSVSNYYYDHNSPAGYTNPSISCIYISSVSVDPTSGNISAVGNTTNLNNHAITLVLVPDTTKQEISWTCCVNNSANYDFIPSDCRHKNSDTASCPSTSP